MAKLAGPEATIIRQLIARVDELRPLAARAVRNADLERNLAPLCPCKHNGANVDAEQACPLHGDDSETFVIRVKLMEDVLAAARRWHGTDNPDTHKALMAAVERYERSA